MSDSTVKIVTVTGKPESGKRKTISMMLARRQNLKVLRSVTTKPPRDDDKLLEYEHVSHQRFMEMKKKGEFLWTVRHNGFLYGTSETDVQAALTADHISVMNLVPHVLRRLHDFAGEEHVVSFLILEESHKELLLRLIRRGMTRHEAENRLDEVHDWTPGAISSRFGIKCINVLNEDEDVLGKKASRDLLDFLDRVIKARKTSGKGSAER